MKGGEVSNAFAAVQRKTTGNGTMKRKKKNPGRITTWVSNLAEA